MLIRNAMSSERAGEGRARELRALLGIEPTFVSRGAGGGLKNRWMNDHMLRFGGDAVC
jgi:hypothetical protein